MEYCVILVTVPNQELGERIARVLVEGKLAACVNRVPGLISIYSWQGKVEQDSEELLIIKTRRNLIEAVSKKVKELHAYEVPEVIALPIIGGSPDYCNWIGKETVV